jgi:multimeric flavodoxin WrbA
MICGMSESKHLLIVAHNPSPNTQKLVDATLRGASHADINGVEAKHIAPLQANADDVFWADAIILGTTENFGYMSGALKDFFDRIYNPCLEHTEALPFAVYIRAGLDGTGTRIAIGKITTGLKWKPVQETIILHGDYQPGFEAQCEELGMLMAASLEAGII